MVNYVLARFHKLLAAIGYVLLYASVSFGAGSTTGGLPKIAQGEVQKGYDAMDTAVTLAILVGIVIVAIGFVLGAIKYMKDDMQGGKDIIVKCVVAAVVVVLAPTMVRFIVGTFKPELNLPN